MTNPWGWVPVPAAAAGFTPARYNGHTIDGLQWTSIVWADAFGVMTNFLDDDQVGVTRAGSAITVAAAGTYEIDLRAGAYHGGAGNGKRIGFRLLVAGAPVRYGNISYTDTSARFTNPMMSFSIPLAAGAVLTIEYCIENVGSTFANFTNVALNGVSCPTATLAITRVS